jgi:hypothetical protein
VATLVPTLALLDGAGANVPFGAAQQVSGNTITVKKFVLPGTGTYSLVVGGTAGSGLFDLRTKGKAPTKVTGGGTFPAVQKVSFGVLPGSVVKGAVAAAKGSTYQPTIVSLVDQGGALALQGYQASGAKAAFKSAVAPAGGATDLNLGGTGTGAFVAKLSVKAPKAAALVDLSNYVPPGVLVGTLVDRDGNPVVGADVKVGGASAATTRADGSFRVERPAGTVGVLIKTADGVVLIDQQAVLTAGETTQIEQGYVSYSPASDYAGRLTCKQCHAGIYGTFSRTGHGFKLNPVVRGQMPTYPFSSIAGAVEGLADAGEANLIDKMNGNALVPGNGTETDNALGTPQSYDDISYVIGGFGWKARFIDLDGYIVTGSAVQYNLETQAMAAYSNDETNKPYDCGACHTTGWKTLAQNGNVHQDGRPGMLGTFEFPAIECEQCHGAGKAHANAPKAAKVAVDRRSQLCGTCHTRDTQNRISAKGGFTEHHEQFDELVRLRINDAANVIQADGTLVPAGTDAETRFALAAMGKHFINGITCNVCHDPHATTVFDAQTTEQGLIRECVECHAGKARTSGTGMTVGFAGATLQCIDCHMPRIGKSAVAVAGGTAGEPQIGDITAHLFAIDLTKANQFTADGKFTYPYVTPKYACLTCHGGDPNVGSQLDLRAFDFATYRFHQ